VSERIESTSRLADAARAHGTRLRVLLHTGELDTAADKRRRLLLARTGQFVGSGKRSRLGRARPRGFDDAAGSAGDLVRVDDHVLVAKAESGTARAGATRAVQIAELGFLHDATDQRDRARLI